MTVFSRGKYKEEEEQRSLEKCKADVEAVLQKFNGWHSIRQISRRICFIRDKYYSGMIYWEPVMIRQVLGALVLSGSVSKSRPMENNTDIYCWRR